MTKVMATVSTCIIVKNEVNNLPLLIEDLRQFSDEIIIVDTGSDDGTYDWLIEHQDVVLKVDYFKWIKNFSAARNYSFSKATMDWIFWCDADDRISEGLINVINNLKQKELDTTDLNAYYFNYQFGKEVYVPRLRLLKRIENPYWIGACHEYVWFNNDDVRYTYEYNNDVDVIVHQHEQGHAPRNLPIFINMVLRQPVLSGRDIYYLSNELRDNGYPEKSVYAAKQCLFMPDMCLFDCWNAIVYNLYQYWLTDKNTAIKGIETITAFMKDHPMRGDVYYVLSALYEVIGDFDSEFNCCKLALDTVVDAVFEYGEVIEYSKILPAIYIFKNTKDNNEREMLLQHLNKYKDNQLVIDFMNTIKNGDH